VGVVVALALLLVGSGYGYLRWRFSQVHKQHFNANILRPDQGGRPTNLLLVGSDTRSDIPLADRRAFCERSDCSDQSGPSHTDTIMILHVDPKERKAAILSIPRDLSVPIAGTGKVDRINTAFGSGPGGPERLIQTIKQNLGIAVNHYAEVDFVGFKRIVDAIGGVTIPFPSPARDAVSRLDVKASGCVKLDGTQALAYARSRYYEYFEAGRWREDPRSDLGRVERQQLFIQRMMQKAISSGLTNPLRLNRLVGIGIDYVTIDSAFSSTDVYRMARRFRSLRPETVDLMTLPTAPIGSVAAGTYRGQAIVTPLAQPMIDRINGVAANKQQTPSPAPVLPSTIRLRVLNGTGRNGLAGQVQTALQDQHFVVVDKGDADNFNYAQTVVRYVPAELPKAQTLRHYMAGPTKVLPDANLKGVDAVIIVGADWAGVLAQAVSGASTSLPPTSTPSTIATPSPVPSSRGAPVPLPNC
jgi:LCP family protein required for cell wall assembly